MQETQETWTQSLGWEDPLKRGMAAYSSILAWEITWAVEPGRTQSTRSQRVGHDLATKQQLRTTEFLSSQVSILLYWVGQKVRLHFSTRHKNVLANQTHGCTPSF